MHSMPYAWSQNSDEHDPQRAKFRTWFNRIAQNAILNALTRIKPDRGSGNTEIQSLLNYIETNDGGDSDLLRLERRRELFRRASRIIVDEFQPENSSFGNGESGKAKIPKRPPSAG